MGHAQRRTGQLGAWVLIIGAAALSNRSAIGADPLKIEPRETWSGYFSGQDVDLGFRATDAGNRPLQIGWAASVQKQVVARREITIAAKPGRAAEFTVKLHLPDAEPRAILPAAVTISLDGKPLFTRELWIFPREPFSDQRKALSALPIVLFDPEQKTARLFEKLEIDVRQIHRIEDLDEVDGGLVLAGEGIALRDYRDLAARLLACAARGLRVLCLAPAGGSFELPRADSPEFGKVRALNFRKTDVIADFDKRLDRRAWPPDGKVAASTMALLGERGPVIAEFSRDGTGWPWLEIEYAQGGRFVFCGWAVVEKWESGPAPQYIFRHVIEHVHRKTPSR